MERSQIFETIKELIVKELQVEPEKVTIDASFESDLGADSLDAIELVCALEETFGLSISDEESMDLKTVKQIVDYVEAHQ
ncbi:acyl carrier protein [bacterium]|nr:acyl carrier protein [bacterium]